MPQADYVELKAKPIREVRASCGCVLVWTLTEAIDAKSPVHAGGRFLWGAQPVVVPCAARLEHVALMREGWDRAAETHEIVDLEQALAEFEKLREEKRDASAVE